MTECIVCYDSFAQGLANICPSCQQAPVCDSCKIQWKERCAALQQAFSCPKCRATIEQLQPIQPNRLFRSLTMPLMMYSWFVDIHQTSSANRSSRYPSLTSASFVSSIVPVMILGSLVILLFSLVRFLTKQRVLSSTFWSITILGLVCMYWYHIVAPLWNA